MTAPVEITARCETGIILARAADRASNVQHGVSQVLLLLNLAGLEIRPEAECLVAELVESANTFASLVLDAADGFAHDEARRRQAAKWRASA